MEVRVYNSRRRLGYYAALVACATIKKALGEKELVRVMLASAPSQDWTLYYLVPWIAKFSVDDLARIRWFHMDEYIGVKAEHPASFRRYQSEKVFNLLPAICRENFTPILGEADPQAERIRLNAYFANEAIDVLCGGIGENTHVAFNDPPCSTSADPFIVVDLDQACRQQQVNDGCFDRLDDVPQTAITASMELISRSKVVVLSVPGERKAEAVDATLKSVPNNTMVPSSLLLEHSNTILCLDQDSARLARISGLIAA